MLTPRCLVVSLVAIVLLAVPGRARADGWDKLGDSSVDDKIDRDEIRVGLKEGLYRWIKIEVERHPVEFNKVIIVYVTGERQEVELRRFIRAGGETRPIRLDRAPRAVRTVIFYYKSTRDGKRAKVVLWGRK